MVFVPKYRRAVINERVLSVLKSAWEQVCNDFECELREVGWEADHVHLLVGYPPKVALSKLVNSLKGVSARRPRAADLPEVRTKLWGDHFWSRSYSLPARRPVSPCPDKVTSDRPSSYGAVSCGGAPLETFKRYIQAQRGGASSPT